MSHVPTWPWVARSWLVPTFLSLPVFRASATMLLAVRAALPGRWPPRIAVRELPGRYKSALYLVHRPVICPHNARPRCRCRTRKSFSHGSLPGLLRPAGIVNGKIHMPGLPVRRPSVAADEFPFCVNPAPLLSGRPRQMARRRRRSRSWTRVGVRLQNQFARLTMSIRLVVVNFQIDEAAFGRSRRRGRRSFASSPATWPSGG